MKHLTAGLLIVISLVGLQACKKQPPPPSTVEVQGVQVDVPKLDQAFATASPEILGLKNEAVQNIRYGFNEKALMALDKLVNDPGLTDPQKKVVNDDIEQMKQVLTKAPPAR